VLRRVNNPPEGVLTPAARDKRKRQTAISNRSDGRALAKDESLTGRRTPTRELGPATGANGVAGRAFDWALRDELCESGRVRRELDALQDADAIGRVRDVKERLSTQETAPLALVDSEETVTRAQLEIAGLRYRGGTKADDLLTRFRMQRREKKLRERGG
jgi:hypothetical protein